MCVCVHVCIFGHSHVEYGTFATLFTLWAYQTLFPHLMEQTCGYSYESLHP